MMVEEAQGWRASVVERYPGLSAEHKGLDGR